MSDKSQFPEATVKRSVYGAQAMQDYIYAPVLVCDLDGTLRYNKENPNDFIDGADTVALYDDVEEKLWEFYREGYMIVGVTNQGGVAFDFKTPEQVFGEIDAMLRQFDRNPFYQIRAAFCHPDGNISPYDRFSMLRKPNPGMLCLIEEEMKEDGYLPNWEESIVVGDREEDEGLAENVNAEFIHANEFFNRSKEKQHA